MTAKRPIRLAAAALAAGLVAPLFSARPSAPSSPGLRRDVLKNGLTLIVEHDAAAAVTVLEILSKGGKRAEAPGFEGLSYLTTRLAIEIPDQSKAMELTERASQWGTAGKGDYSVIHLESLTEHFEPTLAILIGILKDPLFTNIRIDRVRDYMNNQRQIESDDNVNAAHLAHLRLWPGARSYAGSVFGEEASLKKLRSRDVEAFFKAHFAPDNLIVTAVSDLDADKLAAILARGFGDLAADPKAVRAVPPVPPAEAAGTEPVVFPRDSKQVCVSMGFGLPALTERTYVLARLFENLLGKGPGSRLWPLRAERKLAYTVSAQATLMREGGLLEAYLETDPAKRDESLSALRDALSALHQEGVPETELAETKSMVKAEFLRTNETRDRRVGLRGFFEAVGLGAAYFESFPAMVDAITAADLTAFIREFGDPAKATVVFAGPAK